MIEAVKTTQQAKAASLQIRARARELAHDLEHGYLELAKLLYDIYDRSEDGDAKNPPLFVTWGYKTFSEYVDQELGFAIRKAQRLRLIWFKLEVELKGLDPKVKKRLVALGWSKLRELVRVLTLKNTSEWVDKAENMSFVQLEDAVRAYHDAEKVEWAKSQKKAKAKDADADDDPDTDDEVDIDLEPNEKAGPPVPDGKPFEWMHFKLDPEQFLLVHAAFERAAELTEQGTPGYDKRSRNLELICHDFLGTHTFEHDSLKNKLAFLARMESLLGLRLIILDAEAEKLLFGYKALEKFIAANKKATAELGE
jgi:hypothetical protein